MLRLYKKFLCLLIWPLCCSPWYLGSACPLQPLTGKHPVIINMKP